MKVKTFLYSGTAGLAACLLVSCGGGDGNLSPLASNNAPPPAPMPVDSQAPTLNFTGSSTDVQGGETVVLSVLANDNVDAQVDVMISCDGGNLQSDFLRTLETDTPFTITCTANASDAAGNATVETIEISVGTTLITPNLGGDSLSLSPGEYGGIDFEGVLNSDDEVSALLAGEDLPIIRQGNSLIFFTPLDASVGTTVLTLTVGQRVFTFDVEIEASPSLIVDARQSLETQIDSLITEIDGLIPDFGENDPLGMELAAVKMQLETTLNDLENITASDLDIIARIVASNIGFDGELDAQSSTLKARSLPNVTSFSGSLFGPACGSTANAVRDRIRPLFTSIFLSGSGYTLISGASSISGLAPVVGIAGTALGVVAAGIGIVAFARNLRALRGEFIEFTAECSSDIFENFVVSLIDESRGKLNLSAKSDATLSKSSRLIFTEGEAEQVLVMGTPTLFDEVTDVPQQLGRLLASLTDIDVIPDSLTGALQDLIDIDNEIIDSELLEVSNISRDDISAVFDTGSLTFSTSGEEDNSSNIDFSFDIGQGGGVLTTIQAQLNILPEADDVMIMVTAGETVTGTVQTRGAESVRLTSNPAQGQATLETDGGFSYTANSGASGQDSFSYEAVNANGVSDPATVFVDIEAAEEEEETPSQAIGDFSVAATLFNEDVFNNNGITPNQCNLFIDDTVPGPFSLAGSSNRDATFTISETNEGDFSINVPDQWQPAVGSPVSEIINNDIDEEGRPGFDFFRSEIISSEIGPVTITERIGMSFIDDSFDLRAESEFNAEIISENSAPIGLCQRSIRTLEDDVVDVEEFNGAYQGTVVDVNDNSELCGPTTVNEATFFVRGFPQNPILDLGLRVPRIEVPGTIDSNGNARFSAEVQNSVGPATADFSITPSFNLTGTLMTRGFSCNQTETFNLTLLDP